MLSKIEEEVAWYGPEGCDLDRLWCLVEAVHSCDMLDREKRESIWRELRASSLQFILSSGISAAVEKLSSDQVKEEYGNSLRVVAPPDLHKKVLMQYKDASISKRTFVVLQKIAYARERGIAQSTLATELGLDAGGIYHSVKKLEKLGLISRHPVVHEGTYTNMCYHVRFAPKVSADNGELINPDGSIRYDVMKRTLIEMLEKAKDYTLPLQDILSNLNLKTEKQNKWARNFIRRAERDEKYLERVKVITQTCRVNCIRLVKQSDSTEKQIVIDSQQAMASSTAGATLPDHDTESTENLTGADLDRFVLSYIIKAGEKGVTRKELESLIPNTREHNIRRSLARIMEHGLRPLDGDEAIYLYPIIEHIGRSRCYRYFTAQGLRQYKENRGDPIPEELLGQPTDVVAGKKRSFDEIDQQSDTSSNSQEPYTITKATGKRTRENEDMFPGKKVTRTDGVSSETNSEQSVSSEGGSSNDIVRRPRRPMKGTNITMDKRKKAIVDIVYRDKIRELNQELGKEVSRQTDEANQTHKIARTTLIRLAESLHESKSIRLLKTMTPTYGGGLENKVLLLHPDISQDDERVRQFLSRLRASKAVSPIPPKRSPVIELDGGDMEVSTERSQHDPQRKVYTDPHRFWRHVAVRHGWLDSVWLRARVLHEHIFSTVCDSNDLSFCVTDLLMHLPLNVYLRAIGVYRFNETVEDFLLRNEKADIRLSQIPSAVEAEMIPKKFRLRASLLKLLSILEALELVEPLHNNQQYRLAKVGKVKNYAIDARPVIREYTLDSIADVQLFWKELQFACTCLYPTSTLSIHQLAATDVLRTISVPNTWNTRSVLTEDQRAKLDSYIDRKNGKAPIDDNRLILHLARELGLYPTRIKGYFEGVVRAYDKEKTKLARKQLLRKKPPTPVVKALVEATASGKRIEIKHSFPHAEPTFAPTRKLLRHRVPPQRTIVRHVPWLIVEQDILKYGYVIMRHRTRSRPSDFVWKPLTRLLPDKTSEQCRRQFSQLRLSNPQFSNELAQLEREWERIYEYGLAHGEINDDRPWDPEEYDIKAMLEYFVSKLRDRSPTHEKPVNFASDIGNDVAAISDVFEVYPSSSSSSSSSMSPGTVTQEYTIRANQIAKYDALDVVASESQYEQQVHLAAAILKMVLLTPADVYKPEDAHAILKRFPAQVLNEAVEKLKRADILIKEKANASRRIPGRVYNLSDKFIRKFYDNKFIPNTLFEEAARFAESFEDVADLDDIKEDGAIAVLLSMVSAGAVSMQMTNSEKYLALHKGLVVFPKPVHVTLCNRWIDAGMNVTVKKDKDIPRRIVVPSPVESLTVKLPDRNESNKLLRCESKDLCTVYRVLGEFGERGASYKELNEKLLLENDDINVKKQMQTLIDKSFALRVGFKDQRLVAIEHARNWLVQLTSGADSAPVLCKPRMWCNIYGDIIPKVLHDCARAILKHILQHPGINRSSLQAHYNGYMTPEEVEDVLAHLVSAGAVDCRRFVQQRKKVGLFTKPTFYRPLGQDEIGDCIQTHYWPTRTWWMLQG